MHYLLLFLFPALVHANGLPDEPRLSPVELHGNAAVDELPGTCEGTLVQLAVFPADFASTGSAQVEISQNGAGVFSGPVPMEFNNTFGVVAGVLEFCAIDACLSITISEIDVPLDNTASLSVDDFVNQFQFALEDGPFLQFGTAGGAEICDGLDNDCDGEVDEGFIWYTDADGDGFGDDATGVFDCTAPPNTINVGGDCDDSNPDVHPGATEVCDGLDTNCDGTTDVQLTGCTDPMACNYDPNAVCEDGSCAQGSTTLGNEVYSPNWTALDSEGNTVELYALLAQGKTVVLDLFAAWCAPSIQMLQNDFLQDWNAHMGPDGTDHIRMVQVAIDQSAGSLAPFIAAADWPVIINDVEPFATLYGGLGLFDDAVPTLIMICPDRTATMIYPTADQLPYTGVFNYDPIAGVELLNTLCGCRGTPCVANIGCMDSNACDYDPDATCPGPCAQSPEWFVDNDGDGVGGASLGSSCTQPANSAAVGGDCDDDDPNVQEGFTLQVLTEEPTDVGTAHYLIQQGSTIIEGDLDLPAETFGVGVLPICLGAGCFTITISQNDVPLWEESFLFFPDAPADAVPFFTFDGYQSTGTTEICDGIDNDCDGQIDEGIPVLHADADGDGFGDPLTFTCLGTGVNNNLDCDDTDPAVFPGQDCFGQECGFFNGVQQGACGPDTYCFFGWCLPCADADGDGLTTCDGDCNDNDPTVFPGATELCDGLDNDCNGLMDDLLQQALQCPGDTTVILPPLDCSVAITWTEPQTGPCTAGSVFQLSGPLNGSFFGPGTELVSYGLTSDQSNLLLEDFSNNSAGWALDVEWMIGPASSSSCAANCSGNDPSTDHSLTADNGVAGMNIGGCVSTSVHGFRYLTSPNIDASGVSGTLTLEFWRHLHGDFAPFMQHHVQVFDGTSWVTVWQHIAQACINDMDWTQQVIDVTAFKNALFAVRFGQAVGQGGAFSSGGWNLDDVRVFADTGFDAQCSFTIAVLPSVDPGPFICDIITLPTDPGQCTRALANIPMDSAFMGCTLDSIQVQGPGLLPVGTTTLTYTGWSNGEPVGACSGIVTIVDEEVPTIACNGAMLLNADDGSCEATNVVLLEPVVFDNCTLTSVTNDHTGSTYPIGTTLVTWTALDASGNSVQCVQSVTVTSTTTTPVVTDCTSDTTLLVDPITCNANFTYPVPALVGNCASVPLVLQSGLPSGSDFPPGLTTVTYGTSDVLFEEDFSDNEAGWVLGPEWQIGPAVPSSCGGASVGNDPAQDHTGATDNGVAGMVIGGCVTSVLHPAHHLTSPLVDVSGVSGSLTLSFWRHLHGDHLPFMDHTVDVFDGTTWITIWSHSEQAALNDLDWTLQSFDVTPYKSAFFQVRFGQSVGSAGAFTSAGWSIDDVRLIAGVGAESCSFTVTVIIPTTFPDTDGDGLGDPCDACPLAINGIPNFDENTCACELSYTATIADIGGNDVITACTPVGACTDYILELQSGSTNPNLVTYEVLDETGTSTILSGNNPFPVDAIGTLTLCLPDGCYQLRVTDAAGDGLLGYVLRETGANGRRIIDNAGNMANGASQIANGGTFCVPIGNTSLIYSNCDKMDWVNYQYLVCNEEPLVSAEWQVGNQNNDGYNFWIFDPNGSYSYRRFHTHAVSDGFSPASATRAARIKINGWNDGALTPHIPSGIMLNVRVRGVYNWNFTEWGPTCTMMIDPVAAACPQVWLQDDPANPSDYSCGVTRNFGGPNSNAIKLTAKPPQFQPAPLAGGTGVRYQFRFRIPGEGVCIVRPPQTSPTLYLNWSAASGPQLEAGMTYEVEVRVSKDQGATWCVDSPSPACDPDPVTNWGRTCDVTIGAVNGAQGESSSIAAQGDGTLTLYPNPNKGEQLFISLTELDPELRTVSVDIYEPTGKRVMARTIAVQDGYLNTALDLNGDVASGLYLVNITAGDKTWNERLVIQK